MKPQLRVPDGVEVVDVDTPIPIQTIVAAVCEHRRSARTGGEGFEKGFLGGDKVEWTEQDDCRERPYRLEVTCSGSCRVTGADGEHRGWHETTVVFSEVGDYAFDATLRYDKGTQHLRVPVRVRRATDLEVKLVRNIVEVRVFAGDQVLALAQPDVEVDGKKWSKSPPVGGTVSQLYIFPNEQPQHVDIRYRHLQAETVVPARPPVVGPR